MNYLSLTAQAIRLECGESGEWDNSDDYAPLWLAYAVLATTKGMSTTSKDVHDAWSAWAEVHHKGEHRSLIAFDELTPEVQALDDPYRDAIHAVVSIGVEMPEAGR